MGACRHSDPKCRECSVIEYQRFFCDKRIEKAVIEARASLLAEAERDRRILIGKFEEFLLEQFCPDCSSVMSESHYCKVCKKLVNGFEFTNEVVEGFIQELKSSLKGAEQKDSGD